MIFKEEGSIFSLESLNEKVFRLKIFSPNIAQKALPGNFCHLRVNQTYFPLLRRAFSFHKVEKDENSFELLIKVIGSGTEILSRKNPGEKIDLLAPLGNSFTIPKKNEDIVFLAGGMGIAPLFYLIDFLLKKKYGHERITLFFGIKKKEELILTEELVSSGIKLHIATEDGSLGYKGMITSLFYQEIKEKRIKFENIKFYACGPNPMLKEVSSISRKLNINCQVSLENHMPCGIGACLGCVMNTVKGYKRVCKDGPVFDAREVILD